MKKDLQSVCSFSQAKINELQKELDLALPDKSIDSGICIYACGSLGRLELGKASDLDLFFITHSFDENSIEAISEADEEAFFSEIRRIYKEFNFPKPSRDGRYLKFIPLHNILDIGSQEEDYNNSYTARMLLLLESKPLYNLGAYDKLVKSVVDKYFIDYPDHTQDFNPQYLMNDIKRYWYTLCLNYEYRRDEKDDTAERYRKRLKLKFARRITCFSMLACLYKKGVCPDYVVKCVKMTPFERFEMLAEGDKELTCILEKIKKEYEHYLILKTHHTAWWENDPKRKTEALNGADRFQHLVNHEFMSIIARENSELLEKMDLY